ncbi:zinc ribbon domain-containing protein [Methanobacterium aggregans]|uniref:zinc ribbon domain-containing protein n=1 Tax=Methanobacterium aggregans TaxID=1615586 RepID=UPI001AE107E3|nr:zinc ribbon domain-containing protein [Methanobacterium aggregans]MBP2046533.1 ribosomal protein L40E [Methanobacterium aggregans]
MLKSKNELITDEKGGFFAFGPWWFVLLIMVIAFIASALSKNDVKENPPKKIYDYNPTKTLVNPLTLHIICPKCGNYNSESAKFCTGCGSTLVKNDHLYCSECGAINSLNAKFCQECGKELNFNQ